MLAQTKFPGHEAQPAQTRYHEGQDNDGTVPGEAVVSTFLEGEDKQCTGCDDQRVPYEVDASESIPSAGPGADTKSRWPGEVQPDNE